MATHKPRTADGCDFGEPAPVSEPERGPTDDRADAVAGAPRPVEHFVTLFDASFLPIGLALYHSLVAHARPFRLWVVAIDDDVEQHLGRLALPGLMVISLSSLETPQLLAV